MRRRAQLPCRACARRQQPRPPSPPLPSRSISDFSKTSAKVQDAYKDENWKAEIAKNPSQFKALASLVLGTDAQVNLSDEFKAKLIRTLFARLCAALAPTHNRISALFRGGGLCVAELAKVQVKDADTLSDDVLGKVLLPRTNWADVVKLIKGKKTFDAIIKELGADGGRDIYDIQLVDGSVGEKDLARLGYEKQTNMGIGPKLVKKQKDGQWHDELNGPLCEPSLSTLIGSCSLNTNAKNSRKILVFRRDNAIKAFTQPDFITNANAALPAFNDFSKFNHPISDATLVQLPRDVAGIDRKPYDKALSQGWRLVTLLTKKKGEEIKPTDLFDKRNAKLQQDSEFKATVESANLNAGTEGAPIVLLFIRRGGATPLEDIVSLPFHAFVDDKGDVTLERNDFVAAEKAAAADPTTTTTKKKATTQCSNLITPSDCTIKDTATQEKPLGRLVGIMTNVIR